MLAQKDISLNFTSLVVQKLRDYQQLAKLNLSLLVVFSSVVGYLLVPHITFQFTKVALLAIGGLLVTIAANASNEIWERHTDKLMKRTQSRPLPDNRMNVSEAILFVIITLITGLTILFFTFNTLTCLLSIASFVLYVFAYTPLKKISPIAVLVGAIPGSLPCLIGWVAGANEMITLAAWTLFIIQFFWQFPHFWSIAWLGHTDYKNANLKMLPNNEKAGNFTAIQCVLYSSILIPFSILPKIAGLTGNIAPIILAISGICFFYFSLQFLRNISDQNARKVMFASFIYLPVILIALLIDKI